MIVVKIMLYSTRKKTIANNVCVFVLLTLTYVEQNRKKNEKNDLSVFVCVFCVPVVVRCSVVSMVDCYFLTG